MSSQQQIDANRLNAQKSTGPSTPEGRAAVSLNGLKYGLYAQTLILPGEDPAEFDALLDRFHAEHQPATPTEEAFVSQIVMATWRRARIQRMEVAYYKHQHKEFIRHDDWYRDLDDTGRLALIASRDAVSKSLLDSFSRQEARLDRAIKSAVHELRRCRADRRAPENPENDKKDPGPIGFALQIDPLEHPKNPSTAKIISIETQSPAPETAPPTDK